MTSSYYYNDINNYIITIKIKKKPLHCCFTTINSKSNLYLTAFMISSQNSNTLRITHFQGHQKLNEGVNQYRNSSYNSNKSHQAE